MQSRWEEEQRDDEGAVEQNYMDNRAGSTEVVARNSRDQGSRATTMMALLRTSTYELHVVGHHHGIDDHVDHPPQGAHRQESIWGSTQSQFSLDMWP